MWYFSLLTKLILVGSKLADYSYPIYLMARVGKNIKLLSGLPYHLRGKNTMGDNRRGMRREARKEGEKRGKEGGMKRGRKEEKGKR